MTITPLPPLPTADATLPQVASYIGQVVATYVEAVDDAAQMAAPGSTAGLTTAAVDALPVATGSEVAPAIPVSVGAAGSRQLKVFDYIPARQIPDLDEFTSRLPDDILLEGYSAKNLRTGKFQRGLLSYGLTGAIIPETKSDTQVIKDAITQAGSAVVQSASRQFSAYDVGKVILVSNAGAGGAPIKSTIASYTNPGEVIMADPASVSGQYREVVCGTDDTAALAAAYAAAAPPGPYTYGGAVLLRPGMTLTGPTIYPPRTSTKGWGGRISSLARLPTREFGPDGVYGRPLLYNANNRDDFPVICDIGLFGAGYVQAYDRQSDCFNFISISGDDTDNQVDPFPSFSRMHIWGASKDGYWHYGRGDGDMSTVHAEECFGYGVKLDCYDMNIVGVVCEANLLTGLLLNSSAGNNNIINLKCSYNGTRGTNQRDAANCAVYGQGTNVSNFRFQESYGSNLVLGGKNNNFSDGICEDAGDTYPVGGNGNFPLLPYRAAVTFVESTAIGNAIRNVTWGGGVHETYYGTHGVFFENNASANRVIGFTRPNTTYYNGGNATNGTVIPGGTGAYSPAAVGYTSNGGLLDNKINIDDVQIN